MRSRTWWLPIDSPTSEGSSAPCNEGSVGVLQPPSCLETPSWLLPIALPPRLPASSLFKRLASARGFEFPRASGVRSARAARRPGKSVRPHTDGPAERTARRLQPRPLYACLVKCSLPRARGPAPRAGPRESAPRMYAELTCRTNYTFLTGASHPEELVERARALGLCALAITDRDGLYGIVKAHLAAKEHGLKLLVGTELTLADAPPLTLIARDLEGYRNLCRLITRGRTARPKGESLLPLSALEGHADGLFALLRQPHRATATRLRELFDARLYLGLLRTLSAGDERRVQEQLRLSRELGVAPVAINDVHTHDRERQPLQDVLVCIREKTTLDQAGRRLFGNGERTLKSPREMAELFADLPEALDNTLAIAEACTFSLDQIAYQFPEEDIPAGHTPISWLRELT
ncbi:MAG TPA: hypothetical protein DFS52_08465, partial [Myxococcales bacterium]|nr:hypothetical protein [Myxococcales bacterium]